MNDLCLQRVLTTEYIHGFKVSDVSGMEKAGINIEDVDKKLINAFAEQIFHTGFVHADPHPGNGKLFVDYHAILFLTFIRYLLAWYYVFVQVN